MEFESFMNSIYDDLCSSCTVYFPMLSQALVRSLSVEVCKKRMNGLPNDLYFELVNAFGKYHANRTEYMRKSLSGSLGNCPSLL